MDRQSAEEFVLLRNQLCFALFASSRMIVDAYGPILKPLGLTYEGYLVMMVLWEEGRIAEHALAERLRTESETLAVWTDELEAEGLLRHEVRAGTPTVGLTESGYELRERAVEGVPDAIRCRLLLPEEQLGALRDGLHTMMENIDATGSTVTAPAD
ncbi:MAG: MarR family transcriptional regulator [Bacteroidota bacterium]